MLYEYQKQLYATENKYKRLEDTGLEGFLQHGGQSLPLGAVHRNRRRMLKWIALKEKFRAFDNVRL